MNRRAIVAYIAFGLIALGFALLAQLPASLAPRLLQDRSDGQSMRLDDARGSLWRGSAEVSITGVRLGSLDWYLSPLSLVLLSPRIDWQLDGTGLSGRIELDEAFFIAQLDGTLDLKRITPLLVRFGMDAEGRLRFDKFQLTSNRREASLAGRIDWTGGRVEMRVGAWQGTQLLPAMRASAIEASRMLVTLRDEQAGTELLAGEIELLGDGWVKLGATGHLTKRFNPSMVSATDPDAVLVSLEERLL